jgi:hypothetical protein
MGLQMNKMQRSWKATLASCGAAGITALALCLAGCSSKTTAVVPPPGEPTGLPAPAPAGPVNTYSGAQSPGEWTLTLDNTQNAFSYQSVTYPGSSASGALTLSNGFTQLANSGYALEVEGRAAVLRPGSSATPPVFAVPQTSCYAITGRQRFQYIGMQTGPDGAVGSAGPTLGYGSIVASTDSTGKAWAFQDLAGNIVGGPGTFTGSCGTMGAGMGIALSGPTLLNDLWPPDETVETALATGGQSNLWVGPSGFIVADQNDPTMPGIGASVAGVAEPAVSLSTSDVVSHSYLGFLYEPATVPYGGVDATPAMTSPVSFGTVAASGTTMTGGIFPGDDVTQTPNADILMTLGSQNATYNGLYTGVVITVLDPNQNCANYTGSGEKATSSINAQGFFTCSFAGVAIIGNPEDKYAIFVTSYNWAAQLGGAPMQFYLFQQ